MHLVRENYASTEGVLHLHSDEERLLPHINQRTKIIVLRWRYFFI